jgi:hypothetical protein
MNRRPKPREARVPDGDAPVPSDVYLPWNFDLGVGWELFRSMRREVAMPVSRGAVPRSRRGGRSLLIRVLFRVVLASVAVAFVGLATTFLTRQPSNDREWIPDMARLPGIVIEGDELRITGIRNSRYDAEGRSTVTHYDRTFDLAELETVWFILSPFRDDWRGPAHSFLSFGFADSSYLAVSIEARKEVDESYSIWKGMVRTYELTYVLGDERDLIALRANIWKDDVYVYPVKTTPAAARELLIDVLERALDLQERPRFYNTLTQNCTSILREHVNRIAPGRVPPSWKLILTGYSDQLALDAGLLDWEGDIESARRRFRVNDRALAHAGDPGFSRLIREAD